MEVTADNRRRFLQMLAVSAASASGLGGLVLPNDTLAAEGSGRDAVIEAAKSESGLTWYDHYDHRASEELLAAFRRTYPFVRKAEFIDVPSAQKTAKVIQESMAGGPTADVLLNDAAIQKSLFDRGLLHEADWGALGVATSETMTPTSYMVAMLTPPYVVLYNTDRVKDTEVPKSWEEAFDPKWQGRTGHWMRASFFVNLIPALGEAKARDLVTRLAALHPRLFDGQFPLAQAVGSGELALAVTSYDSSVRLVEKGAPVKMAVVDPVPFGLICGSILKYGRNPNTARLFLSWLATPEGAITFERLTKRGNTFVEGTETSKLLKGHRLSYNTPQETLARAKTQIALEAEFSRQIAGR